MPLHDWSKVPAGAFHHFHQAWSNHICERLNEGLLPDGLFAMVEQKVPPREADVLAIESLPQTWDRSRGGVATMNPPTTRVTQTTSTNLFARKSNIITVSHEFGKPVAVIEIVSPGNKDGNRDFREFIAKTLEYFAKEVHVLVIDLLPPSSRDPQGVHKVIWDEIDGGPFELPAGQDRVIASYEIGLETRAFVNTLGVGEDLPDSPLFLDRGFSIDVPLEATYMSTWNKSSKIYRDKVLTYSKR